ncbi:hypothetical protein [Foetidibacter luteolus]|uniref:hypothetical protein n=1 Tax=Foetidibacter luteolus TaxID=2608880 RepID=UPI00129C0312|nr:hypothetical protein [Foetidibacter luteolus]
MGIFDFLKKKRSSESLVNINQSMAYPIPIDADTPAMEVQDKVFVTDKKFFGILGIAEEFLSNLTLVETTGHGWTEKYLDKRSGQYWLKYMVDRERGLYYNLMLLSPRPTTDEMINIAFSSPYPDEIHGVMNRLLLEEEDKNIQYREKVIDRLKTVDITTLDANEKEKIRIIIKAGRLTDTRNKKEVLGKHYTEIEEDVELFKKLGQYAEHLLQKL